MSLKLGAGCVIRVTHGRLWVTLQGDAQDVWLQAGEGWALPDSGTVWLSAEPVAQFQLAHKLTGWRWPRLANLRLLINALAKVSVRSLARGAGAQLQAG